MPKNTRAKHADTTISLAPLTVDQALGAMLKTPAPPANHPARKAKKEGARKKAKPTRKGR